MKMSLARWYTVATPARCDRFRKTSAPRNAVSWTGLPFMSASQFTTLCGMVTASSTSVA